MTEEEVKKQYYGIHKWLKLNWGKTNHCENPNCEHRSSTFEYAMIHEKGYDYKRENFKQLCKVCHLKYDDCKHTPEWNLKVSKALTGKKLSKEHKEKVSKPEDWTEERKQNISSSLLKYWAKRKANLI